MVISRRALVLGLATVGSWSLTASGAPLPVTLQTDLLVKLADYDRNLPRRSGDAVRTLVVVRAGDSDSERYGSQLVTNLGRFERIAKLPHTETVVSFPNDLASLASTCRERRIAVVVFAPELVSEADAIRRAFSGVGVLTVIANPIGVKNGIVLGFELDEGKPRLFLNLTQANLQDVSMSADVMKLMTVFR